jgi:DnaJ family protein B protein 4
MGKDYYKVLGCEKSATPAELKKAYRKLALKWHPDRCAEEKKADAQAKFQEVGEAYDVLSDPEKKKLYDQVGEEGMDGGGSQGEAPGGVPSGFRGSTQFSGQPGPGGGVRFSQSNAEDIFKSFFGTSDPFAGALY